MSLIEIRPVVNLPETQQIITKDMFPNLYALETPIVPDDVIYDDLYSYGLPSTLTPSVDPKYVTGPQKYEYRYVNNNGIDVIIRGTYDDVMSSVDVLNTYPPLKRDCTQTGKREYVPLFGPGSRPGPVNVPFVGIKQIGRHIHVSMDNKTYSGSGSIIMVVQKNRPFLEAKFVLFRDSKNKEYQETGGRIDHTASGTQIDKSILFNTAVKETEEESMKLFKLVHETDNFVDFTSNINNTSYRLYLYLIVLDDIRQLPHMYDVNRGVIVTQYASNFNESYRETDNLVLFDYVTFMEKLNSYGVQGNAISAGTFQTVDGSLVKVRGRTLRGIAELRDAGVLDDVVANKKSSSASITSASGTNLFNEISI